MITNHMIDNADALKAAKMQRNSGPYFGGGTGGGGKVYETTAAWATARGEKERKGQFSFEVERVLCMFRAQAQIIRADQDQAINQDHYNQLAADFF